MGRIRPPKASLKSQLVAVRRAASSAALECRSTDERLRIVRSKAENYRDNLVAAAMTLAAVESSREALAMMPAAHRDQLAIRLAALGMRAVLVTGEHDFPEVADV